MKKRLVAFLLVLIMVLGMLPVSAFAADDGVSPQALESNETQTIKYQILYVGDEFNTAGTTATQTTYTIYLVAKKAVPPTVMSST